MTAESGYAPDACADEGRRIPDRESGRPCSVVSADPGDGSRGSTARLSRPVSSRGGSGGRRGSGTFVGPAGSPAGWRASRSSASSDRVVQLRRGGPPPSPAGCAGPRGRARRRGSPRDQPYASNQAAFIGTVITVPSPSLCRPVMPTTPPQVRWPTTGPSLSSLNAAVIMSPSEEVASSASATTGPRGALRGVGHRLGVAGQVPAQDRAGQLLDDQLADVAARVAPYVHDQRGPRHLHPQVAVELGPAGAAHVGDVQIAAPAAAQLPYHGAAFGHPVLVAQRPLVDQRDDRDAAGRAPASGRARRSAPPWCRPPPPAAGTGRPPGRPGGRRHG